MQKENQPYNIQPADRLANVSEYYFSRKLKEVARMNAEGKDVISLGIGSPDMPPSEETINVLCENAKKPDVHGYQPTVGIPELRRAMADWYKRWYNVDLNPDTEIQPLIGSKEGILHVTLALVNPGDQVLVPNPGYPTYTSLNKILGSEIVNYNLREDNHWQPDFDELERMDLSRVKIMWTNYPNMPTGAGRLRTPAQHRDSKRQPVQLHPEPQAHQYSEHSRSERMLHRIQFDEQKPQHAGLACGHDCYECHLYPMDIEDKEQHRLGHVPPPATCSRTSLPEQCGMAQRGKLQRI